MSAWGNLVGPGARATKLGAKAGSKGGGAGADADDGESTAKTRAKKKILKLNKHYRTELTKLEEAYNNAEEGSKDQLTADMNWYATQKGWIKQYKELAPEAGLKLTAEDDAWISSVDKRAALAEEKWKHLAEPGAVAEYREIGEDDDPAVESVDKPERGTPTAAKSFAELQQKLAAETEADQAKLEATDRKLAKIKWLRGEGEVSFPGDAQLVADEGNLKKERAALSDRIVASTRKQAELGGGGEGVPARSPVPGRKPSGRAAWEGWEDSDTLSTIAKSMALATGPAGFAASQLLGREKSAAPSGYLVAPTPPGGASPETLAALTGKRDKMKATRDSNEVEITALEPAIAQLTDKLMHQGRSIRGGLVENEAGDYIMSPESGHSLLSFVSTPREDDPDARALDQLQARRGDLLRKNKESDAAYAQMNRGISRMQSVLTDKSE
tara:strand:- start:2259 stop:3584 length:1326 start_codon:yes stop_codon:yes gene_type:complete